MSAHTPRSTNSRAGKGTPPSGERDGKAGDEPRIRLPDHIYDRMSVWRGSLRDLVIWAIRYSVFSGALVPGERINQVDIADVLDVSPIPVREALASLEREGLIQYLPRKGYRVADLSRQDINDHFLLFAHVSGELAERAADTMTDEELSDLAKVTEAAAHEGDGHAWHDHARFHRIVARGARSPRLAYAERTLSDGFPAELYANVSDWADEIEDAHRQILVALERHDGRTARQLMEQHVNADAARAIEYLEENGFWK